MACHTTIVEKRETRSIMRKPDGVHEHARYTTQIDRLRGTGLGGFPGGTPEVRRRAARLRRPLVLARRRQQVRRRAQAHRHGSLCRRRLQRRAGQWRLMPGLEDACVPLLLLLVVLPGPLLPGLAGFPQQRDDKQLSCLVAVLVEQVLPELHRLGHRHDKTPGDRYACSVGGLASCSVA